MDQPAAPPLSKGWTSVGCAYPMTPNDRAAAIMGVRPLMGNSSTSLVVTACPREASWVSRRGASAVTSTEAETSPTSSLKSMIEWSPEPMFTPLRRAALNPGDCTEISYWPGRSNGAVYWPELSDTAGVLVAGWGLGTLTFGPR